MAEQDREARLVWIDLEMTGLNPRQDVILEIASIVTEPDLEVVAEGPCLPVHWPEEILARMKPIVRNMHTKNGLIERVREATLRLSEAERQTMQFLREHCTEKASPLCGNTVWMDRVFLMGQMPQVDAFLHHRVVDVSSLKELARRWRPDALQNAPTKPDSHRALDDIRASVEELRHYREVGFLALSDSRSAHD